jgi:hypothetical protein
MLPSIISSALPAGDSGTTSGPPDGPRAERLRQKRRQVARACDGCRTHRIKCDNNQPCSNCKSRGRHCSHSDAPKSSTLSEAYEEIGHLRQKIQELEVKLEHERNKALVYPNQHLLTPPSFSSSPSQGLQLGSIYSDREVDSKIKFWEGIRLRPARSSHDTWFGPSSLYFFIKRLSLCLSASLQQTQSADHMLLCSESSGNLLDGPTPAIEQQSTPLIEDLNGDKAYAELSPTQEEYFLNLFWESYHTSLFAILDEAEFKKHYQSLWTTSGSVRKPSALVDIVLAMCLQYGISKLPVGKQGSIAGNTDATIAGRWHYRRCQTLLTHELESPTISTLQCHLLCAIYLCGGSFHNMVDSSCSLAVKTAYMLGLHLQPPPTMPEREREKRKRLWWAVYVLDSKTGMKLGRPFLLHDSHAMPGLPGDSLEAANLSGSTFAPIGDNVTWLTFNLHHAKLFKTVRAAHTAFYDRDLDIRDGQTIWDNSQAQETSAELLLPYTKDLQEWINGVPNALKTERQNDGRPLSTDGSALEIEQFAPLWLQRQRLLIELTFHTLCINLYRPIIPLGSASTSGLVTEEMAMTCAAHAIALTKIAHQVLTSTSILDGWHEVFQWQWKYVKLSLQLHIFCVSLSKEHGFYSRD